MHLEFIISFVCKLHKISESLAIANFGNRTGIKKELCSTDNQINYAASLFFLCKFCHPTEAYK